MLHKNHYEYEFTMQSCDNRIETDSADSFSITLKNTYIWSYSENPFIIVYYTDDLSLKQNQLSKFNMKTFSGVQGYGEHLFRITNLSPFTRYLFYVVVQSRQSTTQQLLSNPLITSTFDTCKSDEWPEVGVYEESKVDCTIGYHASLCSPQEGFQAAFTDRRDPCYCAEEVIAGTTFPMTQYNKTAVVDGTSLTCGWKGIWDGIPSRDCPAEDGWEATADGETAVKKCDNGGQLTRQCRYGTWQEVEDMNCKCAAVKVDGIKWGAANREETVVHQCMLGQVTRTCSYWGHWEEPVNNECACAEEDIWTQQPHNSTQSQPCGTENTEGNVVTRFCGFNGFWQAVDFSTCKCDALSADEMFWESTMVDDAAFVYCEIGAKARLCLDYGRWDDTIGVYSCMCAADQGYENTEAGVTASLPCPDNEFKSQTRYCNNSGVWSDINSMQCYGSCPAYGRFPVTLSGTTGVIECDVGGGRILMDCLRKVDANGDLYGEWDFASYRVEGECLCKQVDEFPSVAVSEISEIQCDSGKRAQKCGKYTARWEAPVNHDCKCTVSEAPLPVAFTPLFEETVVDCQVGTRSVVCGKLGKYENMDASQCFCGEEDGFAQTAAEATAMAACPEHGDRSRLCSVAGFWSEIDSSACMCNGLSPITNYLPILGSYTQTCPVGSYDVECSASGTTSVSNTCACEAIDGFPETPANTFFQESCGAKEKTAYCNINGEWTNINNPCYCPATSEFPSAAYGELVDAYVPQCYKGYCNPETGAIEVDFTGCACLGRDEWPDMQHGENITLACETGGYRYALCERGVLSVNYEDCNCVNTDNTIIEVGDYLNFPCMVGFILKQCRGNNFWYDITDSYCGCSSDDEGLNLFEIVNAGESKTVQCGAGSMSIQCDATGHYDMDSLVNECMCTGDAMWSETPSGMTVTKECVSGEGYYTRTCGTYGIWGDVNSSCMCAEDGEWAAAAPGVHTQTCAESGVTIERTCHADGSWGAATGSCLDRSCPADGVFPNIPHLGSYTHTCGNGVVIVRTCNGGVWSAVDWSECGCADEDGFVSGEYIDEEVFKSTSSQACGVGQKTRVCLYGVWQAVNYADCFCPAMDVLPSMPANNLYTHQCGIGSITASCNNMGEWDIQSDTCGCAEDSDSMEDLVFPATLRGESVSFNCLSGSMTRTCNLAAQWEEVDTTECLCEGENWTSVHPTENSQYQCEEGYLTRMCKTNGQWGAQSSASCACSATLSYPRTVVLGTALHQCGTGYTTAVCGMNGWEDEQDFDCSCIALDEYPASPRDTTVSVPCGQYKEGMKTRLCNTHGFWEDEEDTSMCVDWCDAVGEWPYTQPGTTVTLPCPEGYTDGAVTRTCNAQGIWEAGVSTCIPMKCPAEDGFPLTVINGIATRDCPAGFVGSVTRHCDFQAGAAVWSELEDTCQEVFCAVGDHSYKHEETVTLECGEGYIGQLEQVCRTGVWETVKNTCSPVICAANEQEGIPEGKFNDVYNINCGLDFTGSVSMRCNALQEWEYVSGSCTAIQPTLRCVPADDAVNVNLAASENDQFTIYCTSNVRIREVINDQDEHMNIHVLFDLADSILSYPTRSVFTSDYTVAFVFDGSLPPACEGILYINALSFISMSGISFPTSTLVSSFATRAGTPLVPPQLPAGAVEVIAVDAEYHTATLKITLPFSTAVYDEGQIAFIRSNLQSRFFTENVVIVEGAILNSVIPITWRVRKGKFWSDFAAFTVYQPTALIAPSTPVVASYHTTTVEWKWEAGETYGESLSHYKYEIVAGDALVKEGTTTDSSLILTLDAGIAYRMRVASCVNENEMSAFSAFSEEFTPSAILLTPSVPRDISTQAVAFTHMHIQWKEPAECGGASIQYYILRRGSSASMQVIEEVFHVSALEFDLYDVTDTTYLEIAAFNGYTSSFVRFTCIPPELTAVWTTNVDEGIQFDNAIHLSGEFNFMSTATCTLKTAAYPSFVMEHVFPAGMTASFTFTPLFPETLYEVYCIVKEVSTGTLLSSSFPVSTIATADLSPSLIVNGEATDSITANVHVTSTVLGSLTCYVALYEGASSRPVSAEGFTSNWAETKEVTSLAEAISFHFPYDVNGVPINHELTYHAWCTIERDIRVMEGEQEKIISISFPEYSQSSSRHTLQVIPFEITHIDPAEFAFTVDPSSDLHLTFSAVPELGEGSISLIDSNNNMMVIHPEDIHCVETSCTIQLHGLIPNMQYVLQVEKNAFKSGEAELEHGVDNWFFTTGYYRCDTKFVSRGLTNTRMCKCFSVDGMCECECGETSVGRLLQRVVVNIIQ